MPSRLRVKIRAWCQTGDKPLSEPMIHICITRPQWVNEEHYHDKSMETSPGGSFWWQVSIGSVMAWCRQATSHTPMWHIPIKTCIITESPCVNPCHFLSTCKDVWAFSVINSSPPSAAMVQIMACRLFDAKPLTEPMLTYCELKPWEQTSVKLEWKYQTFLSWKYTWKCCLPYWRPFLSKGIWGNDFPPQIIHS